MTILSTGLRWLWLTIIIFILDLGSKKLVTANLWFGMSVPLIPFINLTYVHNPGAAFSFLSNQEGWQRWVFSFITIIIIIILLAMMYNSDKHAKLLNVSYAMIIGGALGNLFDRITTGVVIDFIDFYIGDWHWPIFNVADISISIGALLILLNDIYRCNNKKL